jgi:hypothetical protein
MASAFRNAPQSFAQRRVYLDPWHCRMLFCHPEQTRAQTRNTETRECRHQNVKRADDACRSDRVASTIRTSKTKRKLLASETTNSSTQNSKQASSHNHRRERINRAHCPSHSCRRRNPEAAACCPRGHSNLPKLAPYFRPVHVCNNVPPPPN